MSNINHNAMDSLIFEVFRLHGAIAAAGDGLTEPLGLTSARWQVLGSIDKRGGATVAELARRLGLTRQSVQRVVNELLREQQVELIDNPRHKRARQVVLTPKGQRSHHAVHSIWMPITEEMNKRFGPELLTATARLLAELRDEFRSPTFGKSSPTEEPVSTIPNPAVKPAVKTMDPSRDRLKSAVRTTRRKSNEGTLRRRKP